MTCPEGYTIRKGYTRKISNSIGKKGYTRRVKGVLHNVHPKTNSTQVEAACVKKRKTRSIGKLRKGELIKYGYQYRLSDALRRKALEKAVKQYGALSVYRKLDAVAKLSVTTAPDASKVFGKDRNWIRNSYKK